MKRFTERTDVLGLIESVPKSEVKRLLRHFHVVDADSRLKVKHYPLHSKGPNDFEFISDQLQLMEDTMWFTVMNELQIAFDKTTSNKHEMFNLLTSNVKIGKILVAQPQKFSHIGKPLGELKSFAFTYPEGDDEVIIETEINFSVELY